MDKDAELIYELPEAHYDVGAGKNKNQLHDHRNLGDFENERGGHVNSFENFCFGIVPVCDIFMHDVSKKSREGSSQALSNVSKGLISLNPHALQLCCRKHGRMKSTFSTDAATTLKASERSIN